VLCGKLASYVQSTEAFAVLMEWLKKRTDIQYLVLENVAGLGTGQEVRSSDNPTAISMTVLTPSDNHEGALVGDSVRFIWSFPDEFCSTEYHWWLSLRIPKREPGQWTHAVLFCSPSVCTPQAILRTSLTCLCHVARPEWSFHDDRADQLSGELRV
jgi:hypothetical protein